MSGKKFYHQRFRERKSYPNHITHIPASKVKWSAPEVDSLRVKTNLILKGYMASESKDAVFKKWRRLTGQDRVLSPVWETIICASSEKFSGPLQTVHSLKANKFTTPLPQNKYIQIFINLLLSLMFPFCHLPKAKLKTKKSYMSLKKSFSMYNPSSVYRKPIHYVLK